MSNSLIPIPPPNIARNSLVNLASSCFGGAVMRYKVLDRAVTLLMLMGSVLLILWVVVGYGPEGSGIQNTRQQTARIR